MSDADPFEFDPGEFCGVVRLFPLPSLFLFPHALIPLHIFEPRYRELMNEALARDRLITMAVPVAGPATNSATPALGPVASLGKVATFHRLDDGKFNLLLVGLRRVRLLGELPLTKLFREARAEILDDVYPSSGATGRPALQRRLTAEFRRVLPPSSQVHEQVTQLLSRDLSLGMLTDMIGHTVHFDATLKEKLLMEPNVDLRAQWLIDGLEQGRASQPQTLQTQASQSGFPPQFSAN